MKTTEYSHEIKLICTSDCRFYRLNGRRRTLDLGWWLHDVEDINARTFDTATTIAFAKRTDNTDNILDLLTYMPKVLEMYGEYIVNMGVLQYQAASEIDVPEHNSCF